MIPTLHLGRKSQASASRKRTDDSDESSGQPTRTPSPLAGRAKTRERRFQGDSPPDPRPILLVALSAPPRRSGPSRPPSPRLRALAFNADRRCHCSPLHVQRICQLPTQQCEQNPWPSPIRTDSCPSLSDATWLLFLYRRCCCDCEPNQHSDRLRALTIAACQPNAEQPFFAAQRSWSHGQVMDRAMHFEETQPLPTTVES